MKFSNNSICLLALLAMVSITAASFGCSFKSPKEEINGGTTENAKLKKELNAQRMENANMHGRLAQLNLQISTLQGEIQDLQKALNTLKVQTKGQERKNKNLAMTGDFFP